MGDRVTCDRVTLDVGVRHALPDDAATLARLAGLAHVELEHERGAAVWFQHEGRRFDPASAEFVLRADLDERVMLGTINDVVVGFATAHLATLHDKRTLGIITELYVELEGREIGVGDALITEIVESFRSSGAIGVDSWALPGARVTKNFYEAHHFTARALTLHHRFVDES